MTQELEHVPVIVVGVDGSARSVPVLRWAAEQARALHGTVRVVTAWRYPEVPGYKPARTESDLSATVEKIVSELAHETLADVPWMAVTHEDGPVHLLLHESTHADLLVLGSRGHDHADDPTRRLGSVTQSCLLQAQCPVVVIPVADGDTGFEHRT